MRRAEGAYGDLLDDDGASMTDHDGCAAKLQTQKPDHATNLRADQALHPVWFDPKMPERKDCVLGELLESGAANHPERVFARFENGDNWTYRATLQRVRKLAASLQKLGVQKGDCVLVWLPNGPDLIQTWFAINYLGAVYAPINTAYRGNLLEHVIANSGASIIVAHAELCERLFNCNTRQLETVIATGPGAKVPAPLLHLTIDQVLSSSVDTELQRDFGVMPWDTLAIIYTSGTTGASKGILCSHLHFYTIGLLAVGFIEPGERCLVNLPLFHIGAAGGVYGSLARGAGIAVVDGFNTEKFWDQVRDYDCAVGCGLVGSMVTFLASRPAADNDRDNPLRRILVAPVNHMLVDLAARHDFEYFTGFGMGEAPIPLISELNPTLLGCCGTSRSGIECRIVDSHDLEVQPGETGELVIRSDLPWSMNHGYVGMPEATCDAWRNGWFHTGDAFRQDADGNYYFVDRIKDSIRRRGENISSVEVEAAVMQHPTVQDAAAIPVPSDLGEDEVMIVVQPREGEQVVAQELIQLLSEILPYFMVPRYIRIMSDLPKTPTNKVRKFLLREQGVTKDTWDREAAGIKLKREKLS